jgi:hypothetical protein
MDYNDVLAVATRSKHEMDEIKNSMKAMKADLMRKNKFVGKNSTVFKKAQAIAEKQFCEKCGMDFAKKENKKMRSQKTTKIYKVLCKNCAKKETGE